MFAVHTYDLTFLSCCDDFGTNSIDEAIREARSRWDHLTPAEQKHYAIVVYDIPAEDYARIQEEGGDYETVAFEVKVYGPEI